MKSSGPIHLALILSVIPVCHGLERKSASKPIHNLAITAISVPSSCIAGETVLVAVSVANHGSKRESFRVVLAESLTGTELASKKVVLAGKRDSKSGVISDGFHMFRANTDKRSNLGFSLCATGDVNKDGFSDILIGDADINEFAGKVLLFYGRHTIDTSSPDLVFSGEHAGDHFGAQTVELVDFNGDGYDDIIIGANLYDNHDGRVYLFFGGPNADVKADLILEGPKAEGSRFGMAVAGGDIDNDGYADILVGAQRHDARRGRVYLFWGGQKMDAIPDVILEGEHFQEPNPHATFQKYGDEGKPLMRGSWFGRRIDASGDINGDGYNDIIVGARHAGGPKDSGCAYLFLGDSKKGMDAICDFRFRGEDLRDEMGTGGKFFDIDNDGLDDLLVCARYAKDFCGAVYVWWGAKDFDGNGPADVILKGEPHSNMGGDDIVCDDFNNDGYGDILVGGYNYPRWPIANGRAYIFYGNDRDHMDTNIDHILDPEGNDHNFLGSKVSAGDVNRDGYVDALIGAYGGGISQGRAYLYYGPFHDSTAITFNWDTANASIGKHMLKVEVTPVAGEQNTDDNARTLTIEVAKPFW